MTQEVNLQKWAEEVAEGIIDLAEQNGVATEDIFNLIKENLIESGVNVED